jgi:MFS family permease
MRSRLIRSLAAVIVGTLFLRMAVQVMTLMLQNYFDQINVPYTVGGFVIASFFVAELIGAPILGALSDRRGRRPFILLGPALGAIAVQITAMTAAVWLLLITRLLEGLSTASSIPSTLGYISEATSGRPKLRARIVGLFEISFVGGMALGAAAGGYIWKFFSEPTALLGIELKSPAFSLNALIYLISLAIFFWGASESRAQGLATAGHPRGKLRAVFRSPRLLRFAPAWLAINSIIGMWYNHGVRLLTGKNTSDHQSLVGRWNHAPEKVYTGLAMLIAVFAVGVLVWSFSMARYRRTSVMLIATAGLFALLLSVFLMNRLNLFSGLEFHLVMGAFLLSMIVMSGFTPAALTYLADVTEDLTADRGTIMGLYSVFMGIGQIVGTTLGGFFANWAEIDGLLLLSAILGGVTLATLLTLRQQEAAQAQQATS